MSKKSLSSQNSIIHTIKPHKWVRDMTLNELQILFPDISELTKIISESKKWNYACSDSGICPVGLLQKIEDRKPTANTINSLINQI